MDFDKGKANISEILDGFSDDLSRMRSGRASTDMMDGVKVEAYDSIMDISHVASITIPDPKTIVIQPWDTSVLKNIEKAILSSDIGYTPVVDGEIVRVSVPALTQDLREKYVKEMRDRMEKARISIRGVRRDMIASVESQSTNGGISEDEIDRQKGMVESEIKAAIEKIEEMGEEKEKELMTV